MHCQKGIWRRGVSLVMINIILLWILSKRNFLQKIVTKIVRPFLGASGMKWFFIFIKCHIVSSEWPGHWTSMILRVALNIKAINFLWPYRVQMVPISFLKKSPFPRTHLSLNPIFCPDMLFSACEKVHPCFLPKQTLFCPETGVEWVVLGYM